MSCIVRHSPWILLNREAATLIVEDDFSEYFPDDCENSEWCYEGTVLNMKGYPISDKICQQEVLLVDDCLLDEMTAGIIMGSGEYFCSLEQEKCPK